MGPEERLQTNGFLGQRNRGHRHVTDGQTHMRHISLPGVSLLVEPGDGRLPAQRGGKVCAAVETGKAGELMRVAVAALIDQMLADGIIQRGNAARLGGSIAQGPAAEPRLTLIIAGLTDESRPLRSN